MMCLPLPTEDDAPAAAVLVVCSAGAVSSAGGPPVLFAPTSAHLATNCSNSTLSNGLAMKSSMPFSQAFFAVLSHGVGGDGDDRDSGLDAAHGPDCRCDFETVHVGHLDVHQNDLEVVGLDRRHRTPAILSRRNDIAGLLQHHSSDLQIDLVVVSHQNAHPAGRAVANLLERLPGAGGRSPSRPVSASAKGAVRTGRMTKPSRSLFDDQIRTRTLRGLSQ